jgi:hypothetical protein
MHRPVLATNATPCYLLLRNPLLFVNLNTETMAYPLPEPVQFADTMFRKVQEGKANGIRKRGANAYATNLLTTIGRYYPEDTPAERKLVGTLKEVQRGTQPSGDRGSKRAWKAMKGTVSTEPHRSTDARRSRTEGIPC